MCVCVRSPVQWILVYYESGLVPVGLPSGLLFIEKGRFRAIAAAEHRGIGLILLLLSDVVVLYGQGTWRRPAQGL